MAWLRGRPAGHFRQAAGIAWVVHGVGDGPRREKARRPLAGRAGWRGSEIGYFALVGGWFKLVLLRQWERNIASVGR